MSVREATSARFSESGGRLGGDPADRFVGVVAEPFDRLEGVRRAEFAQGPDRPPLHVRRRIAEQRHQVGRRLLRPQPAQRVGRDGPDDRMRIGDEPPDVADVFPAPASRIAAAAFARTMN